MACRPAAISGILTSMLRSWVVCTALILGAVASTSGQTDVSAHMGSIEWAIRQVRWQFPTSFNVERVRSRRVLMLHLTESAASLRLVAAVGEWQQRTPVHDLEVICVWSSISKTELIRQAATLPESWMHADDRALALALQSMRSRGIPYATFYDRSGTLVWQGNADSALIQQLIAWMDRDELPSDPGTLLRPQTGDGLHVEIRPSRDKLGSSHVGFDIDGGRCWARRASGGMLLQVLIQCLTPLAEISAPFLGEFVDTLYDMDIVIPKDVDAVAARDSLLRSLSTRFGQIVTIQTVSYVRPVMVIADTAKFRAHRTPDPRCPSLFALARCWSRQTHSGTALSDPTIASVRIDLPIRWFDLDTAASELLNAGIAIKHTWRSTEQVLIRPSSVPESAVVYLLDRIHAIPTVGLAVHHGSDQMWYGVEAGIVSGRLTSGHGFYGITGIRLCAELLTSHRTIGGFSLGVETSTLFVLRLRGAMYTDFDRFLWLSCIPEIGLGYVGRASITLGVLVPVLGASVVPASVRLSATFNLLPKGAR
jgi:hypothetical protein